jgi:NTP pyrophosphatase (non-canonical NTP hydrolase)
LENGFFLVEDFQKEAFEDAELAFEIGEGRRGQYYYLLVWEERDGIGLLSTRADGGGSSTSFDSYLLKILFKLQTEGAIEIEGALTPNLYFNKVTKKKIYPKESNLLYLMCKLQEECGEVSKEVRKYVEGEGIQKDMKSELGDILCILSLLASEFDLDLESIMKSNVEKLKERNLL